MQKNPGKRHNKPDVCKELPSSTRPVWKNQEMACDECRYNDQDIDTFPCAKCHTRH